MPALEEEDLEHTVTKITVMDLTIILVVSKHKIFRYFNVDERVKEIKRKKGIQRTIFSFCEIYAYKNYVVEFLFFVKNHNRSMTKCNFHIVSWILDLPLYIFLVILTTVTFDNITSSFSIFAWRQGNTSLPGASNVHKLPNRRLKNS